MHRDHLALPCDRGPHGKDGRPFTRLHVEVARLVGPRFECRAVRPYERYLSSGDGLRIGESLEDGPRDAELSCITEGPIVANQAGLTGSVERTVTFSRRPSAECIDLVLVNGIAGNE